MGSKCYQSLIDKITAGRQAKLWPMTTLAFLFAILALGPFGSPGAQSSSVAPQAGPHIVQVKFREGTVMTEVGSLLGPDLVFSINSIKPLFAVSDAQLTTMRVRAEHRSHHRQPDLHYWCEIKLDSVTNVTEFLRAIKRLEIVEFAEPVSLPVPMETESRSGIRTEILGQFAEPPAVTDDFTALQSYLGPAPAGMDAVFSAAVPGGNGSGITIYDIEYSWNQQHEDLSKAYGIPLLLNPGDLAVDPFNNPNHGTAVLGELIADNDSKGVTGIAWGANIGLAPVNTRNLGYNPANAIALAVADGSPGDIILLEQQTGVCGLPGPSYGPVEWLHSVFEAIQIAVANGFVVVEAAGNGGVDLDQPSCLGAFDRNIQDSGAIIVGAGAPPRGGAGQEWMTFSSFGSRVDLQGWGSGVMTTGYGNHSWNPDDPENPNFFYTASFNGTSSASAMVAGAVANLQGIELEQSGIPLTSQQIRRRLVVTGSPQQGDTSNQIGPQPDLRAALSFVPEPTSCDNAPYSIWPSDPTPSLIADPDTNSIEVGVKFRSDVSGVVCGLRFYKAGTNTGVHVGTLWSASGERLASVTFSNETVSGWQSVNFAAPVQISANTVYTASYLAPAGQYSVDENYFDFTGVNNGPLHALGSAESGGNGVYQYGGGESLPTQSYRSSNYWVDVLFAPEIVSDPPQPAVISVFPADGDDVTNTLNQVRAVFNLALDPATVNSSTFQLLNANGTQVPATIGYSENTATLTATSNLASGSTYTAIVRGGPNGFKDLNGNSMAADFAWQFTTIVEQDVTAPNVTSVSPAHNQTGVETSSALVAVFDETLDPASVNSLSFILLDPNGTPIAATVNHSGLSATLNPASLLAFATTYTAVIKGGPNGVRDVAGNPLESDFEWQFTSASAPDSTPPLLITRFPGPGASEIPLNTSVLATFSEAIDPNSVDSFNFELRDPGGNQVSVTVSHSGNTATLQPTSPLQPDTLYTALVKGGIGGVTDLAGIALESDITWQFTTAVGVNTGSDCAAGLTLWPNSATPSGFGDSDTAAVEVGVKFRASKDGLICGIRFYKHQDNSGTHTGNLWDTSGQLLATATFDNETDSGWQQVNFNTPVAITAGTTYIASYHAPVGRYAIDYGYFEGFQQENHPLTAPENSSSGGNGVYRYGPSGFPSDTYESSNYWVDVVFVNPTDTIVNEDTIPPVVVSVTPSDNSQQVDPGAVVTAVFNESIDISTLTAGTFELRDINQAIVPATINHNSLTATLIPDQPLQANSTYFALLKGGAGGITDLAGNSLESDRSWQFTTSEPTVGSDCNTEAATIWPAGAIPAVSAEDDSAAVEIGVKFDANVDGIICGIRFYKDAANTGTHIGNLWNAAGQLLASATFVDETDSGWQQVNFTNPVPITANTTYVASYHAPRGKYAVDLGYFDGFEQVNFPLRALDNSVSGGNGVYQYGSGGFPSSSYGATNYWVDVVFVQP